MPFIVRYALVAVISVGAFSYAKSKWQDWRDHKETVQELQVSLDTKDLIIEAHEAKKAEYEEAQTRLNERVRLEISQADRRERKLAEKESTIEYQKKLIADCRIDTNSLYKSAKD